MSNIGGKQKWYILRDGIFNFYSVGQDGVASPFAVCLDTEPVPNHGFVCCLEPWHINSYNVIYSGRTRAGTNSNKGHIWGIVITRRITPTIIERLSRACIGTTLRHADLNSLKSPQSGFGLECG